MAKLKPFTMDEPREVPVVRIGVSAAAIVVFLLLTALWARSYWANYEQGVDLGVGSVVVNSACGRIFVLAIGSARNNNLPLAIDSDELGNPVIAKLPGAWLGFYFQLDGFNALGVIPYWFPTLAAALLVVAPWLDRFRLRTLLIAMALVAVVLGFIVWAVR